MRLWPVLEPAVFPAQPLLVLVVPEVAWVVVPARVPGKRKGKAQPKAANQKQTVANGAAAGAGAASSAAGATSQDRKASPDQTGKLPVVVRGKILSPRSEALPPGTAAVVTPVAGQGPAAGRPAPAPTQAAPVDPAAVATPAVGITRLLRLFKKRGK